MQGTVFYSSSFGRMVSLSLYSRMEIHFPGYIERKLKACSHSVRLTQELYGPSIHGFPQEM